MDAETFLLSFAILPFVLFLITVFVPANKEKAISKISFYGVFLHFSLVLYFLFSLFKNGLREIDFKEASLYRTENYQFVVDFYFDEVTAVYLFVGSLITLLIVRYSRYYMHLEPGYKRFFRTVLFFFGAYNLATISGNFETLFTGWEMLGISSFLLISFYRERILPVRNAIKVFSIYRIGDVAILMGAWAMHKLWHENITFIVLNNPQLVHEHWMHGTFTGLFVTFCILVAASAKSSQLPFSYWLPRAMEGPTPSSAIFYGSLSVHFGVFLLLRTMHFWEKQPLARALIGSAGLLTTLVAYPISRVQSTIKTQIAYASIAQIGIMFIETALRLKHLVLLHFAGNAFFRTYQLLISPSAVSYYMHDLFYHFKKSKPIESFYPKQIKYSLYVLSLKEFYLDQFANKVLFFPFKFLGNKLHFLNGAMVATLLALLVGMGWVAKSYEDALPTWTTDGLAILSSFCGFLLATRAFSERVDPRMSLWMILANHVLEATATWFNEYFHFEQIIIYLSGTVPAFLIGLTCLNALRRREPDSFDLTGYHGHVHKHKTLGFVFFLSVLGMIGFPITPSFIGDDLILGHIHEDQFFLAFLYASSYVLSGIALIRVYGRLFLGSPVKSDHPTALPWS